jgi:hypothetical protein
VNKSRCTFHKGAGALVTVCNVMARLPSEGVPDELMLNHHLMHPAALVLRYRLVYAGTTAKDFRKAVRKYSERRGLQHFQRARDCPLTILRVDPQSSNACFRRTADYVLQVYGPGDDRRRMLA